jgi:glycosyltransferase involved in cell wall biosynthesis
LRIALLYCGNFHVIGGAERFILDVAKAVNADIICPSFNEETINNYDPERKIKFVSLNKHLPSEPLRQIFGIWMYKNLKLDYDFYIAMDDMSLHFLRPDVPHLYYMLTPRRAYYDMYRETLKNHGIIMKSIYTIGLNLFAAYDRYIVGKNVKNIVCISHNVRNRIRQAYQRDVPVIYPPIHTEMYHNSPSEGYWLSVGRVDKWKRIELQVESFRKMPNKRLIIVGKISPNCEKIVQYAPDNIIFLTNVSEQKLIDLYSKCEGFITTAIDEDFGLTPIEAMASGKPIVATKEGGYLETVIDGHTGILVAPNVNDIVGAIKTISSKDTTKYISPCHIQASNFDYILFKEKLNNLINIVGNQYVLK